MTGITFAGTQGENSALSSFPTVNEAAVLIGNLRTDTLRRILANQGYDLGQEDRLPMPLILDAMQAELDAGRPWPQQPGTPINMGR
jgi:hypothetical protein